MRTNSGPIIGVGLILMAATALGQPIYKVVSPDRKVASADKPPVSEQGSVQPTQGPELGATPPGVPGPAGTAVPAGPRAGITVPTAGAPPPATIGLLQGSKELNDVNACTRANMATLSLIRASEEIIRSSNNIGIAGAKGASTYQSDLLERQWKYYKSLGGTAVSPQQVRVPEDPCKTEKEALNQKSVAQETRYRNCVALHPKEIRLAALSKELASGRAYLAALEKLREERSNNPNFDSSSKGSGEWAALLKADPLAVRAGLAVKLQEYRSAGGSASQLEDVREIPNPCVTEVTTTSRPASISDKRTLILRNK